MKHVLLDNCKTGTLPMTDYKGNLRSLAQREVMQLEAVTQLTPP